MVQPKYSPQEALEKMKLMMKYDSSKTLNENRQIISEQDESCTNNISYDEIKELAKTVGEGAFKMTATFSRMGYGDERGQSILDAVKQVVGKNTYDNIDEKCVSAKDVFDKFFKKYSKSLFGFSGGDNVSTTLNNIMKDSYVKNNFPEAIRMVTRAKQLWDAPTPAVTPTPDNTKKDDGKEVVKKGGGSGYKSKYTPCTPGKYVRGCKSEVVRKVQACLKQAPKHQTGNFGPITQANLQKLGKGFENGFTDADVATICQTETVEKLGDDFESQTLGQDMASDTNIPSNPNQQDSTTKTGIS